MTENKDEIGTSFLLFSTLLGFVVGGILGLATGNDFGRSGQYHKNLKSEISTLFTLTNKTDLTKEESIICEYLKIKYKDFDIAKYIEKGE